MKEEYLLTVLYNKTFEEEEDDSDEGDEGEGGDTGDDTTNILNEVFFSDEFGNPFNNFGSINIEMSRGVITSSGNNISVNEERSVYITNTRSTPIYTRFIPSLSTLNYNSQFNDQNHTYYKAPWFNGVTDNEGNVVLPPTYANPQDLPKTLIEGGETYEFQVKATTTNENHTFSGVTPVPSPPIVNDLVIGGPWENGSEYLISQYGTDKKFMTANERANAPYLSLPDSFSTAGSSNLTPMYRGDLYFTVFNEDEINITPLGTNYQLGSTINITITETVDYTQGSDEGDDEGDDGGLVGDLDGDGVVGTGDLLAFLGGFGNIDEGLLEDIDGDGAVTIADMLLLLGNFGAASDDYEGGVTPLNLCSYPELQDEDNMITISSVISYWGTHQDTFFDLFDPALEVAGADTNDINVFITASLPDGTAINCNIG